MSELNPVVEDRTFCEVHPDRETALRCNKCGRLMCAECAVLTPVGYRCRECVRQHEDKFFTANQYDYLIVFAVSAVLAAIGGAIIKVVGFLLLVIIIGVPVGGAISEAALRMTQRRRGRYSGHIAAAGVVVGGLVGGVAQVYLAYSAELAEIARRFPGRELPALPLDAVLTATVSDISLLIFIGVVAFIVYGRFNLRI
ncbi:MAG: B-box zinc finger protein [Chloroflexi bacterium]|nr:B-box zinc finger protein [Chloroflexota bacterium]